MRAFNLSLPFSVASLVLAAPFLSALENGEIVAGEGSITTVGDVTTINQITDEMIINWADFDIAEEELVQFLQGSELSVALNRVLGTESTEIYGGLLANGRVFILNPNGILFGNSASIDVGGLMATTLSLEDSDFLNGDYDFYQDPGQSLAYVVNEGRLVAGEDGFVHLVAPGVENSGLIVAKLGQVVLGSGSEYSLDFGGDGSISFAISGELLESVIGPDGEVMESGVSNSGSISSEGGQVLLSGDFARSLMTSVVNNAGVIEATSLEGLTGSVTLEGRGSGKVVNTGSLDVASEEGAAGSIVMRGDLVGQFGEAIADSNSGSAGTIELLGADKVALTSGSVTSASGIENGSAGSIWAIGEEAIFVDADATLAATGGIAGGDGGFIETSGSSFIIEGVPDVSSALGTAGTWLIDPSDITIVAGNGNTGINAANPFASSADSAQLGVDLVLTALDGGNVSITTQNGGILEDGDITLATDLTYAGGSSRTLTLNAANDVIIDNAISATNAALSLKLNANSSAGATASSGAVAINAAVATNGGAFTATGIDFSSTVAGTINTEGSSIDGAVSILNTGLVEIGGAINVGASTITMSNSSDLTLSGDLTAGGLIDLDTYGDILGSGATITAGSLSLTTNPLDLSDPNTERGGSIGSSGSALQVEVSGTISATADDGGIFLQSGSDLNLGAIDARFEGSTAIETDGAIAGEDRDIGISTTGNITLTSTISGSGDVTVAAGGTLMEATDATDFIAGSLTISGDALGTSDNPIETSVGTLNATADVGGLFVLESGSLATGDINVVSDVSLVVSQGDVSLGGSGIVAGDSVTIESPGDISDGNGNAANIDASAVTLTASGNIGGADSIGLMGANEVVATTDLSGADILLSDTVTPTDLTISVANGDVSFDFDGESFAFDAASSELSLSAAISELTFENSAGGIVLNGLNMSGGVANLGATGAISQTGSSRLIADEISLASESGLGASGAPLLLNGSEITLTALSGSIFADNTQAVTLNALAGGSGSELHFTNTGDLTVDSADGDALVELLVTGGGFIDGNGDEINIASNGGVVLESTSGGLGTNTDTFEMLVIGTMDISVSDDVYLHNQGTVSEANITTDSGDVDFENSGSLALGVIEATSGNIDLQVSGDLTDADDDDTGTPTADLIGQELSIAATSIGASSSQKIETSISGNVVLNTTDGGIFINQVTPGLALELLTAIAGGTGSNIEIVADGDVNLGEIKAESDQAKIVSSSGAITDKNLGAAKYSIVAKTAILDAANGVTGTSGSLKTKVSIFSANGGSGAVAAANDGPAFVFSSTLSSGSTVMIVATDIIILDGTVSESATGQSLLGSGSGTTSSVTGDLSLTATAGNIVFLNLDDTISATGDITLTANEGADEFGIEEGGAIVAGNLTTTGGDILIDADKDVTIGKLDAGWGNGDITMLIPNGIIVDANGSEMNLVGDEVTLVVAAQNTTENTLRQTLAIADYVSRQSNTNTADLILDIESDNLQAESSQLAAALQAYNSAQSAYNSALSTYSSESLTLSVYTKVANGLYTALDVATVIRNIAYIPKAAAQAAPLTGDGGADLAFAIVDTALSIASLALASYDRFEIQPQASLVEELGDDLATADAVYDAADLDYTNAQAEYTSAEADYTTALEAYGEALMLQSMSAMLRNQAFAVIGTNAIGTETQALGVDAAQVNISTGGSIDTFVSIESSGTNPLGLGNINQVGETYIDASAINDILIKGRVGDGLTTDVFITSASGEIDGTSGTTDDTIEAENLILSAANGIGTDSSIDTQVDNLAAANTSGDISIVNANTTEALTITDLNGVIGVTTDGDIDITTSANLVLEKEIADTNLTTDHTITLVSGGKIIDADGGDDVNLKASGIALTAASGIADADTFLEVEADNLEATTATGGLYLIERDHSGLTIGGVTPTAGSALSGFSTTTSGDAVILLENGTLTVTEDSSVAGNILLQATEDSEPDAAMIAISAEVVSTEGHISIMADDTIDQQFGGIISTETDGNTIDVWAQSDIVMYGGSRTESVNGVIRYESAGGDIYVEEITTGVAGVTTGAVGLFAFNDVLESATESDFGADITAQNLLVSAGGAIGVGGNHLDTQVETLTTTSVSGGAFLTEADDISTGAVTGLTVERVQEDGSVITTDAEGMEDLTSGGDLVLETLNGSLTVHGGTDEAAVEAKGNILLAASETAEGTVANVVLNGTTVSTAGNISVTADDSILQNAPGDLSTQADGKTIDFLASDAITMEDGAVVTSVNGAIRFEAVSGDITLGELTTGIAGTTTGSVGVFTTTGSVLDLDTDMSSVDITAQDLIIKSNTAIGESDNHLEVSADRITTLSKLGSTFVEESDDVVVDRLTMTVERVQSTGGVMTTAQDLGEDLVSLNDLVFTTVDGSIMVNGGGDAIGVIAYNDLLIEADEASEDTVADLTLNASVIHENQIGAISLFAADDIQQNAAGDILSSVSGTTIDLGAQGSISMVNGALTRSTNGNIRYAAETGDITVGEITTGGGATIGLFAPEGSVLDLAADSSVVDLTAQNLIMSVGTAIGESTNHLETTVDVLSMESGAGGAFVVETNSVVVDDLSMTVERVQTDGSVVTTTADVLEDLTSAGDLVLSTVNGSLTVNGGTDAAGILADEDILLSVGETSEGTVADAIFNASVTSTGGNFTLLVDDNVVQHAAGDFYTDGDGKTLDVVATGSISMDDGALTQSTNGVIRYESISGDITLGELSTGTAGTTTGTIGVFAAAGNILDLATDTSAVDLTAENLILTAAMGGIAQSTNHLETQVENLSTASETSTFVEEADSVAVEDLSMTVERVQLDGSLVTTTADVQEDLTSGADLVLSTLDGTITVTGGTDIDGVLAQDDILISARELDEATTADVVFDATMTSTAGNLTVLANDSITQNPTGDLFTLTDGKTIDLKADDAITMTDGALTQSVNGAIRYEATTGDITLGEIATGPAGTTTGVVGVFATAGNILDLAADTSTVDITAQDLILSAGESIGEGSNHLDTQVEVITTESVAGSTFVLESDNLIVDDLDMTVERVQLDGSLVTTTPDVQEDLVSGADLVVSTIDGSLIVNGGTDSEGIVATDDILLSSNELAEGTEVSTTFNATMTSTAGNITVLSDDSIVQNVDGDVFTEAAGKTIDFKADDSIAMVDGALTQSVNGAIRYEATTGDITLGELTTGPEGSTTGIVGIFATAGSILDLGTDTSAIDITAQDLILSAGTAIAESTNHLETQVEKITTESSSGSTFVEEADSVAVEDLDMTVERVQLDGSLVTTTPDVQEDLVSGADLVLTTVDGSITVTGGTDSDGVLAQDDILISAGELGEGTTADVAFEATVTSTAGNMTVLANDSITQNASGDLFTETDGKTIDLKADDSITMDDGALTQSVNGAIRYEATTGDITLGELATGPEDSTTGVVGVFATAGSILDLSTDSSAVDITSQDLILSAGTAIGEDDNHLETQVESITTESVAASTFVEEADSVVVDDLDMTVERVQLDGSLVTTTPDVQEDLTSGADLVLTTVDGSLTVNGGTDSDGVLATEDILLRSSELAEATDADTTFNATVVSTSGNITIDSRDSITQNIDGDISTETDEKTIDLFADDSIMMVDGAVTTSVDGAIRYEATTGDIVLGELTTGPEGTTTGDIGIFAIEGRILDLASDSSTVDITAQDLILSAGVAIAESTNHLETQVENVTTASRSGSTFVQEADSVVIDDLSMTVERVQLDGSLVTTTPDVQEDLSSGSDLVLSTLDGSITVNGGTDTDGVLATDDILISAGELAEATDADATFNATVTSTAGNLTVLSKDSVTQNPTGDFFTATDGKTIDVKADDSIVMKDGALTQSNNGAIRYEATTGDIILGELTTGPAGATTGVVGVFATTGSILDLATDTSAVDITAQDLILSAGAAIAESTNHLETQIEVVTTFSGSGSTFVEEADGATVDDLDMTVERVQLDGSLVTTTPDVQEDLVSGADLVMSTVDGSLTINGGTDDAGVLASDDILLSVNEVEESTEANLTANATVTSTGGNLTVLSDDSIQQNVAGDFFTQTDGKTIDVKADDAIAMVDGALTQSVNGAIRYEAATGDITLGELTTGAAGVTTGDVGVFATEGSILDLATDTSTVDITTRDLILSAGVAIAENTNHLETQVEVVTTESVAGSTFVQESDALVVDDLSMTVERVQLDGLLVTTTPDVQEDLVSGADLVVTTVDGSLTVNGGTDDVGVIAVEDILFSSGELAEATDADSTFNATVTSESGNITILSRDSITQNVQGDLYTELDGATIDLVADDSIAMVDGAVTQSVNGAIRYEATTGDITLGEISSGVAGETTGVVGVFTTAGDILDLASDTSAVDITAQNLILSAGSGIATSNNHLETQVDVVTTESRGGSTFVEEADSVIVDNLDMTVERVQLDGSLVTTTPDVQEDLESAGDLMLSTVDGSLIVNGGTDQGGVLAIEDVLLSAGELNEGTESNVLVNASVVSTAGNLTIFAKDDILQTAIGDLATEADGATIDLVADHSIAMNDGALTQSVNGAIRYEATTGDIILGELSTGLAGTTTGIIGVFATVGSILDLEEDTSSIDLTAESLILSAGNSIGTPTNHLETQVEVVTTESVVGDTFMEEADALIVDDLDMTVARVQLDGSLVTTTPDVQEDLVSGGDLVVSTMDGSITVNGGTDAAGIAATEDIRIVAGELVETTGADLIFNASVTSSEGNLMAISDDSIIQNIDGDLYTTTSGRTIALLAQDSISMVDGALTESVNGAIRYEAETGDINVGQIIAGGGEGVVGLFANEGHILDLDEDSAVEDIIAHDLILVANLSIARGNKNLQSLNYLEILVDNLASNSVEGDTFITETDDVHVEALGIMVADVLSDGDSGSASTSNTLEDLTAGGDLVLRTIDGSIVVNGGTDTSGVVAVGAILLEAGETEEAVVADLVVNASITSIGDQLTLSSVDDVIQNADGDLSTELDGASIVVDADGSIVMLDGAMTESVNGEIRYEAATGDITVAELSTGEAGSTMGVIGLFTPEGSILDLAEDSSGVDITSAGLILVAGDSIATGENALETQVDVLAAGTDSGGIYLSELDDLVIDGLSIGVSRMRASGRRLLSAPDYQEDLSSGDVIELSVVNGNLTIEGGSDESGVVATNGFTAEVNGNILVNASVASTDGSLALTASDDVEQTAAGDLSVATASEAIAVTAGGSIVMADGAVSETVGGTMTYIAGSDVRLGSLNAGNGSGDVSVTATEGSIYDNGDDALDVIAAHLDLTAGSGVAPDGNAIDTSVASISASVASGDVNINESDSVTLDDFTMAGGNLTLGVQSGSITVGAVSVGGDANLEAANGSILDDGDDATVITAEGLSLSAGDGIGGSTGLDTQVVSLTAEVSGAGSIDIDERDGLLVESLVTGNGDISLSSETGNIAVTSIVAGGENSTVTLVASDGGIRDATDGDAAKVVATNLAMSATDGIGEAQASFEVDVENLVADGGTGGVFIAGLNPLGINIGGVTPAEGSPEIVGLTSTGGDVVIQSEASIAINETVSNSGGGMIRFGTAGTISQNADIAGSGDVVLEAVGAIQMAEGTTTSNVEGAIILASDTELVTSNILGTNRSSVILTSPVFSNPYIGSLEAGSVDIYSAMDATDYIASLNSRSPVIRQGDRTIAGVSAQNIVFNVDSATLPQPQKSLDGFDEIFSEALSTLLDSSFWEDGVFDVLTLEELWSSSDELEL